MQWVLFPTMYKLGDDPWAGIYNNKANYIKAIIFIFENFMK